MEFSWPPKEMFPENLRASCVARIGEFQLFPGGSSSDLAMILKAHIFEKIRWSLVPGNAACNGKKALKHSGLVGNWQALKPIDTIGI